MTSYSKVKIWSLGDSKPKRWRSNSDVISGWQSDDVIKNCEISASNKVNIPNYGQTNLSLVELSCHQNCHQFKPQFNHSMSYSNLFLCTQDAPHLKNENSATRSSGKCEGCGWDCTKCSWQLPLEPSFCDSRTADLYCRARTTSSSKYTKSLPLQVRPNFTPAYFFNPNPNFTLTIILPLLWFHLTLTLNLTK